MNYRDKHIRRLVESFDELDEQGQSIVLDKIKYRDWETDRKSVV